MHARQRQTVHEAQDRIRAGLHPKVAGLACTGLATGCKPGAGLSLREAAGPACSRRHQLRERLREGAAAAGTMMAVEAPDAQVQRHRLTNARQIGRTAFIAAVNGRTGRATGRTPAMNTLRMGDDGGTTVAVAWPTPKRAAA